MQKDIAKYIAQDMDVKQHHTLHKITIQAQLTDECHNLSLYFLMSIFIQIQLF